MASMIYQLYLQMKSGKRPRVFKAGEHKRDFVHVDDVVNCTLLAMNSGKIHLLLRNSTDQQLSASALIRVSSLAGETLQTKGGGQRVTVIQGTQISTEVVQ